MFFLINFNFSPFEVKFIVMVAFQGFTITSNFAKSWEFRFLFLHSLSGWLSKLQPTKQKKKKRRNFRRVQNHIHKIDIYNKDRERKQPSIALLPILYFSLPNYTFLLFSILIIFWNPMLFLIKYIIISNPLLSLILSCYMLNHYTSNLNRLLDIYPTTQSRLNIYIA